jgi:hypothetical protein
MIAFLDEVEEKLGGFEGYVRNDLGFGEEDFAKIRSNLTEKRTTTASSAI